MRSLFSSNITYFLNGFPDIGWLRESVLFQNTAWNGNIGSCNSPGWSVYKVKHSFDRLLAELKKRDPILLFRSKLMKKKVLTEDDVKRIDDMADAEVAECRKFAEESPYPDPKVLREII